MSSAKEPKAITAASHFNPIVVWENYWTDALQRSVLMLDTLRRRGNTFKAQSEKIAPHILNFEGEVVLDGRTLERPVNYALLRIKPRKGVSIDHRKRPFIVFDPRAGHGPGIGGMKQDSEIGVALEAGHPCYFVGFSAKPIEGQTIEDVCVAEATFIEKVRELEPEAVGKPCLIGNCQAGWQIMLTAAIKPDLAGPIILAGSPLSYWAGVRGKNPMRYLGGMLGGTWMTALAGDLGHGVFDGASLVANFEQLHPENTLWEKAYNVYAKIDTEPQRFLDFETWWGSPVLLNAQEMQWIADNLFVGNKLREGGIVTSKGERVDLRNVRSPIVVFCSWGDDITPPPQALGWVLDLYDKDEDVVLAGQTIVYCVHQTIGHLGIFVSGKVATKEHSEFTSCIEMIDLLPPGLYEAVITEAGPDTPRADLIEGKYLFTVEPRSLDDIRAFGVNSPDDEARFATAARVSEINKGLYQTFLSPLVQKASTERTAEMLRDLHPHRLRFSAISDNNLMSGAIEKAAETVRANRRPVSEDNPLRHVEDMMSQQISNGLRTWGELRDIWTEQVFLATYGNPLLQAMVGLKGAPADEKHQIVRDITRRGDAEALRNEVERTLDEGDMVDAVLRAVLYVARGANRGADERSFSTLKAIASSLPQGLKVGRDRLKDALRRQALTLSLDESRALKALPNLLPDDPQQRHNALSLIRALFESRDRTAEETRRLAEVSAIFEPSRARVVHRQPAAS